MRTKLSSAAAPEKGHKATKKDTADLKAIPIVNGSADYISDYSAMGRRFVVLNGKDPTQSYKDESGRSTIEEIGDFNDLGMVIPDGWTVIDFDNAKDALLVLKIIDELQLKTIVVRTTRGIHAWFRTDKREGACFSHERLALGLEGDMKIGGHNAIDKIKQDGRFRECIRYRNPDDVETLPAFFLKVQDRSGTFPFYGMGEGSRNDSLHNYIPYLQQKGFSREEVRETLTVINRYILAEPVDDRELATIYRDESFLSDEEVQAKIAKYEHPDDTANADNTGMDTQEVWFDTDEDGNLIFKHEKFGDNLIGLYHIIEHHGILYIYDGGYYKQDDKVIEQKMIEVWPGIKRHQRAEVLDYLQIKCHVPDSQIKSEPYILNVANGRLDVRTGELLPFTPDAIEFEHLPVTYDPNAYCEAVDNLETKVFLGRKGLINEFNEVGGSMLIKTARYQKGVIGVGEGANGKSTILDMLEEFLGESNYSTVDLKDLGARFLTAELENKLANIGDDIDGDVPLTETGIMKKVITGNRVAVERKGQDPFALKPYATHFYSCNRIPKSFDKSEGFYRRWMIIPFDATFSVDDPDFDPMIEDKVTTDEAKSYLLNLFLEGAQRLIGRGHIAESKESADMLESYKRVNSSVLSWIDEEGLDADYMLSKPRDVLYEEFADWCKQSGITSGHITGRQNFYEEIRTKFKFDRKPCQHWNDKKRYFVVSII